MSQQELARRLGISGAYMSQIFCGVRRPSVDILDRLERVTGVPIAAWADSTADERARDANTPRQNAKDSQGLRGGSDS